MKKGIFLHGALGLLLLGLLSACTPEGAELAENTVAGGAIGAGVGAGTGAIVGSVIANGDIAASAAFGGVLGLPVGLVLGAEYTSMKHEMIRVRNDMMIKDNEDYLRQSQQEIEGLRQDLQNESMQMNPDISKREYQYNGPSLGNPYR